MPASSCSCSWDRHRIWSSEEGQETTYNKQSFLCQIRVLLAVLVDVGVLCGCLIFVEETDFRDEYIFKFKDRGMRLPRILEGGLEA
jgi:hypothetical protein